MSLKTSSVHDRIIRVIKRHQSGEVDSLLGLCSELNTELEIRDQNVAKLNAKELLYLAYIADKKQDRYRSFKILKKSGEHRSIDAPVSKIRWSRRNIHFKSILRTLNTVLTHMYLDRVEFLHHGKPWLPSGFVPGQSIRSNAQSHIGKRYLFHLDLKDFFPTISERTIFLCLRHQYQLPSSTAACLAGVTCFPSPEGRRLAQGAPTSPILSNMVTELLDRRLLGLANKWGVQYSRYADDLTFSADRPLFKSDGSFRKRVTSIIQDEGYAIHPDKVHTQSHGSRKTVTGLVVNEKVNLPRHSAKMLRLFLHWLELAQSKKNRESILAKLNDWAASEHPVKQEAPLTLADLQHMTQGWLSLTGMVRGKEDPRYQALLARYHALASPDEVHSSRRKLQTQLVKLHEFGLPYLEQWNTMNNHSTSYFLELVDHILTIPDTGDADLGLKEELILRVQQYAGKGGLKSDNWVNEVYAANIESHAGSLAEEVYRPLGSWKDILDLNRLKGNFQLMEYWRRRSDLARFAMSLHTQMEVMSLEAIKTIREEEEFLKPLEAFCANLNQDVWKTLNIDLTYEDNKSLWRKYHDIDETNTQARQTEFLECLKKGPSRSKMRFAYLWGHGFDTDSRYEFKRFFMAYLQLIGRLRNNESHMRTIEEIDEAIRKYDNNLRKDKPTKKNFQTSRITVMTMGIMALESFISGLGNKQPS